MLGNGESLPGILAGQHFNSAGELFSQPELSNLISSSFSAVGDAFRYASTSFDVAFESIKKAAKLIFDFVKFDIFTTLFQELGLWFSSFQFPQLFITVFRKTMAFLSLIWTFVLNIKELQMFYIWGVISSILFIIWLIQKRYDPEKELTGPNTYDWENRGTLWLIWTRALVTILTFLYLPAVSSSFNVIFCMQKLMEEYELKCYTGIHWLHLIIAFFILLFIGLYFPWQIYLVITTYKPVPQSYDELGHRIAGIDKAKVLAQYRELMDRDTCPYKFLYTGYEYGWAAYKVITMVVKMLLIIPVTPLIASNHNFAASFSLVVVSGYAITSCFMRPFILDCDDYIDLCSRITAVLTLIVQICLINSAITDDISGYLLTVINIINLIMMIVIFITNMDLFKNFMTRHFGSINVAPDLVYDDNDCRKQKIWQRFWRGLFQSCASLGPVGERLVQMEDIVKKYGLNRYKEGLFPPSSEIAQARRMARELEGVDVYYRSNIPETSYWGRMYINPFPFTCTVVYDNSERIIEINDQYIRDLIHQNYYDPKIVKSRCFRQYLRCLNGEYVTYPIEKEINVRNGFGKVPVTAKFERGILTVKTKTNDPYCHGFDVTVFYDDGVATLPNGEQLTNLTYTAHPLDLGILPDFEVTQECLTLINDPINRGIITQRFPELMERNKMYRDDLEEWREEDEYAASWGFWYMVFNNDRAPLSVIKDYVQKFEPNKELKGMFDLYKDDFDGLESRLKYYDSHPAIAFWYNFFDDIAIRNSGIKQIAQHPELFDPAFSTALMYHPQEMCSLKMTLEEAGLRKSNGKGLFSDDILDEFEEKLEKLGANSDQFKSPPYVMPISENVRFDPRCIETPLITENMTFIASAATMVL